MGGKQCLQHRCGLRVVGKIDEHQIRRVRRACRDHTARIARRAERRDAVDRGRARESDRRAAHLLPRHRGGERGVADDHDVPASALSPPCREHAPKLSPGGSSAAAHASAPPGNAA